MCSNYNSLFIRCFIYTILFQPSKCFSQSLVCGTHLYILCFGLSFVSISYAVHKRINPSGSIRISLIRGFIFMQDQVWLLGHCFNYQVNVYLSRLLSLNQWCYLQGDIQVLSIFWLNYFQILQFAVLLHLIRSRNRFYFRLQHF